MVLLNNVEPSNFSHTTVSTDISLQHCFAVSPTPVLAKSIQPEFRKVVEEIRKKTRVPILIPTRIEGNLSDPGVQIGILSWDAKDDYYSLEFRRDTFISGEEITPKTETFEQLYEKKREWDRLSYARRRLPLKDRGFTARSDENVTYVRLSRAIKGIFTPFSCGANCSASGITWDQGGYRYVVGIKAGSLYEVIGMANSVIENQGSDFLMDN